MNPSILITPNSKKAGKLYSIIPTDGAGDLDVVRATTATYVDADGVIQTAGINEPRFDYSNGSCPSILVEPQRTNLLLRSEEFEDAYWTKSNLNITSNSITSPNGSLTADTFNGNGANTSHTVQRAISVNASTTYTISVFAKKNTENFLQIILGSAPFDFVKCYANFDLNNGVIGTIGPNATAKIENYGNGWFRCSVTATTLISGNSNIYIALANGLSYSVLGFFTSSNSIYVWGAQLEAGANATSYIPTTTTAVTRNADVISKSGISDLIGQTQGTLYWEGRLQGQSFSDGFVRTLLSISDGTTNNRIEIYRLNNGIYYTNVVGGAVQFVAPVFTITDFTGQPLKLAITYTLNDVKVFINGVLVNTDTTALIPACSQINIGSIRTGGSQWSGLIKGVVLLPLLTNTDYEVLTGTSYTSYSEMATALGYTII